MLAALIGFLAPFVPAVINYFNNKANNKHELEMFGLRLKMAQAEHSWKMAEIESVADIEEMKVLHQPMQAYGVQLLDAAKGMHPVLFYPVFYLYVLIDFLSTSVRPVVTYTFVMFYIVYKWAMYETLRAVSDASFTFREGITTIWTTQDFDMLLLVVSYWFGSRVAKAAFGGNATNGSVGK